MGSANVLLLRPPTMVLSVSTNWLGADVLFLALGWSSDSKEGSPHLKTQSPSLPQQIGQKHEEFFSTLYWFVTEREGMQRHESPCSVRVRAQTSL